MKKRDIKLDEILKKMLATLNKHNIYPVKCSVNIIVKKEDFADMEKIYTDNILTDTILQRIVKYNQTESVIHIMQEMTAEELIDISQERE